MKRAVVLGLAWVGGTALSVAVVGAAVATVRGQVADDQPTAAAPFTTRVTAATTTTAPPATTTTVSPTTTLPDATTTTAPATSATTTTQSPVTTAAGSPTTSTPPPPPPTATTTTAPPATTTTASPTTTQPPLTETATYELTGGWVTISYTPGVVVFDHAIPKEGFAVEVEDQGPHQVEVEFESNALKSKFRAQWEGGELDIRIEDDEKD